MRTKCKLCDATLMRGVNWSNYNHRSHYYICVKCQKEVKQEYYHKNKETFLPKFNEYRKRLNKIDVRDYNRKYYTAHKDEIKQKVMQWYEKNSQHKKEYDQQYYQGNKEVKYRQTKEWSLNNPEKHMSYNMVYYTKNRKRINKYRSDRMREMRFKLLEILGGKKCSNLKCAYDKDWRVLQFDHIRDDGHDDRINYSNNNRYKFLKFHIDNPDIARSNLQVLCSNCNLSKKYDFVGFQQ